jgi:hypothetical protein
MSARLLLALGLASALASSAALPALASISTTIGDDDSWTTTWSSGDEKNFAYGLVDPQDRTSFTYGQNADFTSVDVTRAEGKPVVWARLGSKRYQIVDAQTFREAKAILEPMMRISREQGRLGTLQGELGHEQGKIGHEQGKIGHEQGRLGHEQAKLAAKQSSAALEDDDEAQEAAQAKQEEIGDRQNELGRQQANLGKHQSTMGEAQADLGRRQAELGEEMRRIQPRVTAQMKKLLEQSVKDGRAHRL